MATGALAGRIDVQATLHPEQRLIAGTARLIIDNLPLDDTGLHFRLYPNRFCMGDSCGLIVDSLFVNGYDVTEQALADSTDLSVPLDLTAVKRPVRVRLRFRLYVPEQSDRIGYHRGQYNLSGWLPMPAPIHDNYWEVIRYGLNAEPVADLFDIHVAMTHPEDLQVIGAGADSTVAGDSVTVSYFSLREAEDLGLVIGKDFLVDSSVVNGITLRLYYQSDDAFIRDTVREVTRQTLQSMGRRVCPYPFGELTVVMSGWSFSGGLELPRMILLNRPRPQPVRFYQLMVIHEVIHQWFYGLFASDQAMEPWLDESITEHFTLQLTKEFAPQPGDMLAVFGWRADAMAMHRSQARAVMDLTPVNRPADDFERRKYFRTIYNKGALAVQTICNLMGERQHDFWEEYCRTYAFRRPTTDGFVVMASKYIGANGEGAIRTLLDGTERLDFQVNEITSKQIPSVDGSEVDSTRADTIAFRSTITLTAIHPLELSVPVRLTLTDGTIVDTSLVLQSGRQKMTIVRPAPVRIAEVDPDHLYAIDVNLLNNSVITSGGTGVALRLFSGITFLVQSLFSTLWGF